jgi:CubicO group peptidase (beta-lactamase class C family)
MSRRAAWGIGLAFALLAAGAAWGAWRARTAEFPGRQWAWKAPEEAGFSAAKLEAFSRQAGGYGCLVHAGKMIHAWGNLTNRHDVASSCKPVYAFLTLKAIEQGRLGSLDEPVAKWMPALAVLNPELGFKDREITFRHLLRQTSGYGLAERPGEAFAYNDYGTGLLVWTVLHEVLQTPWKFFDDVLNGPWLGQAIGFEDSPDMNHRGSHLGRLRMSVRDQARFAWLCLRGGEWRGRRVLRPDLFAAARGGTLPPDFPRTAGAESRMLKKPGTIGGGRNEKNHLGCLGNFWWNNRPTPDGARLLPDAPPGTYLGSGYGGRFAMVIVPELELVAVWQNVHPDEIWSPFSEIGRFKVNEMLRELLAARASP